MRKPLTAVFLLFLGALALAGCTTDFEVNEPETEIDILYALLEPTKNVHTVKINKAFLNNDESAYEVANDPSRIYHEDSLYVTIEEYRNNVLNATHVFHKVVTGGKDSGIFAYPQQVLYRNVNDTFTPKDAEGYTYKLVVVNTRTQVRSEAMSPVVGVAQPQFPRAGSAITFPTDPAAGLGINFVAGRNAYVYDITWVIHYSETNRDDTSLRRSDTLVWPLKRYLRTNSTTGGTDVKTSLKFSEFVEFLASNLSKTTDWKRKITGIDIYLDGGAQELYNYIQVFRPSIGIVQKRNDYTNINNGYGIFSSRAFRSTLYALSATSQKRLSDDSKGKALGF